MSFGKKEVINALYNGALVAVGAAVIGFASRRITKDGLGSPITPVGTGKLVVAAGLGSVAVDYLKFKELLPKEINS